MLRPLMPLSVKASEAVSNLWDGLWKPCFNNSSWSTPTKLQIALALRLINFINEILSTTPGSACQPCLRRCLWNPRELIHFSSLPFVKWNLCLQSITVASSKQYFPKKYLYLGLLAKEIKALLHIFPNKNFLFCFLICLVSFSLPCWYL